MEIKMVSVADIIPYENNPNRDDCCNLRRA